MSDALTNQERGERIEERLHQLRMSVRMFSEQTGVARKTMHRAITGVENVRASSYREIETWLDKLEAKRGVPREDEPRIEITLSIRESDLQRVLGMLHLRRE